jgi:hypothetical protein
VQGRKGIVYIWKFWEEKKLQKLVNDNDIQIGWIVCIISVILLYSRWTSLLQQNDNIVQTRRSYHAHEQSV